MPKSSKPISKSRNQGNKQSQLDTSTAALFNTNNIVAVKDEGSQDAVKIVQILENVSESSEYIRASEFVRTETLGTFNLGNQIKIHSKNIICDVKCETELSKGKNQKIKSVRLTRAEFVKIKKLAKTFEGFEEPEESEDDDEEDEESESSESEEKPPRKIVKIIGRKSGTRKEEEEELQDNKKTKKSLETNKSRKSIKSKVKEKEQEDDSEPEKAQKKLKKLKISDKKSKSTKTEQITEDEETEQQQTETNSKKTKKSIKEKNQTSQKIKNEELPTKYKKGVYNPKAEIREHCELLESSNNDFIQDLSVKNSNKNLIRAAYTKNHKLLEKILNSENKISTLFETWGPESDEDALYYIFKNNDKKALVLFLDALTNPKFKYAHNPQPGIETIDTGMNSIYTFGVRVRKVNMGRGGREGNNAFTADVNMNTDIYSLIDQSLNKIIQLDTFDPELIKLLRVKYERADNLIENKISTAVRAGNYILAGHLIAYANNRGGYGFNFLHEQALTKKRFTEFKKVSANKKAVGNNAITPIHCAAINPHVDLLKKLLEANPEYSIMDDNMRKPIHYAAACESSGPLEYLLSKGVDPREGDYFKTTPLMIACLYGRPHNVRVLLSGNNSVEVNTKSKEGMTAINYAALSGNIECLKILLDNGAKIETTGKMRMTPLICAASKGHLEAVKYLLENGAKINAKDKLKRNSLILAVRNGHLHIATILLRRGIPFNEPDSSKNYAIHYAAAYGYQECIDALIKAEADPNVLNSWNLTALNVAMLKNQFGCVKQLLTYPETNVNCKDNQGRTIISNSIDNLSEASMEYIEYLIKEKNANINIPDLQGYSPLHYAAKLNKDKVAKNIQNWNKLTEEEKQTETTKYIQLVMKLSQLLLENGADINIQANNKKTPFIQALESHNYDFIDLILKQKGLDLLSTTDDNKGIYHFLGSIVIESEGIPIFNTILNLISNQNDLLNLVDDTGMTPLHVYIQNFSNTAKNKYIQIHQQLKNQEINKKQIEFEKNNPQPTPNINQVIPQLNIPTKKRAPLRRPAKVFAAYDCQQNQTQSAVFLTKEEEEEIKNKTIQQFEEYVAKFQELITEIIKQGADPQITIQKLLKYRNTGQMEVQNEPQQITPVLQFSGGLNNRNKHDKNKKMQEYGQNGLQNVIHLLCQGYPHHKLLSYFIDLKIDLNGQDHLLKTPLHYFVQKIREVEDNLQTKDILYMLLQCGANPNLCDETQFFPIIECVQQNKMEFLEILSKFKADLNVIDKSGNTPLLTCVKKKQIGNTEKLLELGANPNLVDKNSRNALHHAVNVANSNADASFELESLLLRFGGDVNALDKRNRTPLHYAFVKIGQPFDKSNIDPVETVTSLLGIKNCNVNVKDKWGKTPLHYAAQRGSNISGLYLMKYGAEIDVEDEHGNTPLCIAFMSDHSNFAIFLIQNNANVNQIIKIQKLKQDSKSQQKSKEKDISYIDYNQDKLDINPDDEEDEDNQDEEDDNNYNQNYNNSFSWNQSFGRGFGFEQRSNHLFQPSKQKHLSDLEEGEYSMFKISVKKGWQGVAYLMLQSGYDLMLAIMDAMNEQKYQLVLTLLYKTADDKQVQKTNNEKQNLFHSFAINGGTAPKDLTEKIVKELKRRDVDYNSKDIQGRTALHYAGEKCFSFLIDTLLEENANPNEEDNKGYTPFTLFLINSQKLSQTQQFISKSKIPINVSIKFLHRNIYAADKEIHTSALVCLAYQGSKDFDLYNYLLNNGANINEEDDLGYTTLIYSIKENSKKLVNFFLNVPNLDTDQRDKSGKTPVHHVIQPLEFGSYENDEILELVCSHFDLNTQDHNGNSPLYYAKQQDSGLMASKLEELGAEPIKSSTTIKRAPTSIISYANWPEADIDPEEDADKFLEQASKIENKDQMEVEQKIQPDAQADTSSGPLEVVFDNEHGPYNLLMTKVDVKMGGYSENLFYVMQILHQKNRDVYILFTRWGRIGEVGMFQQTPFSTLDEAVKEFKKIFSSKSGNEWKKKDNFIKKRGKYHLLKIEKKIAHTDFLKPFELDHINIPKSSLNKELQSLFKVLTNTKMYAAQVRQQGVDTEFMPVTDLSKKSLLEAQQILVEISELIEEIKQLQKSKYIDTKLDKILQLKEEIAELSSRFYELIPQTNYKNTAVPPIQQDYILNEKLSLINNLLDYEISVKIMLGAHLNFFKLNPLDYCYQALNIRMSKLDPAHSEYQVIQKYVKNGCSSHHPKFIANIYALERRGEADRISVHSNQNKMLLWHGSKLSNFMGILSTGLKVAPPEAQATGYMFGKGIYFADVFDKSYAYCNEYSYNYDIDPKESFKLMLLCEVALGEIKELKEAEFITQLPAPYKSVKGLGRRGPELKKSMTLSNGSRIPIGDVIDYQFDPNDQHQPYLGYNEYIVYDASQVRIRYLIQLNEKHNQYGY